MGTEHRERRQMRNAQFGVGLIIGAWMSPIVQFFSNDTMVDTLNSERDSISSLKGIFKGADAMA